MQSIDQLETLLVEQFGPFIRDSRYSKAFDKAMQSIKRLEEPTATIDIFYLFLHHLVIELFDEIDRLNNILQSR